jgi:hypothetical protein
MSPHAPKRMKSVLSNNSPRIDPAKPANAIKTTIAAKMILGSAPAMISFLSQGASYESTRHFARRQ